MMGVRDTCMGDETSLFLHCWEGERASMKGSIHELIAVFGKLKNDGSRE